MHMQLWQIDYSVFALLNSGKKRDYVIFTSIHVQQRQIDYSVFAVLHSVKKRDHMVFTVKKGATVAERPFYFFAALDSARRRLRRLHINS